jgi:hypothetical protein
MGSMHQTPLTRQFFACPLFFIEIVIICLLFICFVAVKHSAKYVMSHVGHGSLDRWGHKGHGSVSRTDEKLLANFQHT